MSERRPFYIHRIQDIYQRGTQTQIENGPWVQAVALPYTGGRLRAAWWVLTGRAYALKWPKPGHLEQALSR